MAIKLLCLTLIACTLVHAAPKHSLLGGNPEKIIDQITQLAFDNMDQYAVSYETKVDTGVDAAKAVVDAGGQIVKTNMILSKLPIRVLLKILMSKKNNTAQEDSNDESLNFVRSDKAPESSTQQPTKVTPGTQ